MIDRRETGRYLRLTVNELEAEKIQFSVTRDSSGDKTLIFAIRRALPYFESSAFISFDEARDLAQALNEAVAEWPARSLMGVSDCERVGNENS